MAKPNLEIKVKLPWWASAYAMMLNAFASLQGLEPDAGKYARLVVKHSKVEISASNGK